MRVAFAFSIVLACLIAPPAVQGQATQEAAETRTIVFEHDGRRTTGYALYARSERGAERRVDLGPATPDESGTVRIQLPVLPPGTYRIELVAYNGGGESARIVASPARVTVAGAGASSVEEGVGNPTIAPAAPTSAAPPAPTPPRTGFLGRMWRIVAGSDGP